MRTAQDIMTREVITINPEADITEAVKILLDKGVNGSPVIDDAGRLVGILCQSDLVRMQKNLPIPALHPARRFRASVLLGASRSGGQTHRSFQGLGRHERQSGHDSSGHDHRRNRGAHAGRRGTHTLPVTDKGKLLGVVGKKDVIKTLIPRP